MPVQLTDKLKLSTYCFMALQDDIPPHAPFPPSRHQDGPGAEDLGVPWGANTAHCCTELILSESLSLLSSSVCTALLCAS